MTPDSSPSARPVLAARSSHEKGDAQPAAARTVASALAAFNARYHLDTVGYTDRTLHVRLGPLKLPFPNPGHLRRHDLHHVALDVPPDLWGEVEVSILELRSGTPTLFVWFLCASAVTIGALLAPLRVWRLWRRYAGCKNVYRDHEYTELLALDLTALRRLMHLPQLS